MKRTYFLVALVVSLLLWIGGLALLKYIGIKITWLWVFCPIWLPLLIFIVLTAIALFFEILNEYYGI